MEKAIVLADDGRAKISRSRPPRFATVLFALLWPALCAGLRLISFPTDAGKRERSLRAPFELPSPRGTKNKKAEFAEECSFFSALLVGASGPSGPWHFSPLLRVAAFLARYFSGCFGRAIELWCTSFALPPMLMQRAPSAAKDHITDYGVTLAVVTHPPRVACSRSVFSPFFGRAIGLCCILHCLTRDSGFACCAA